MQKMPQKIPLTFIHLCTLCNIKEVNLWIATRSVFSAITFRADFMINEPLLHRKKTTQLCMYNWKHISPTLNVVALQTAQRWLRPLSMSDAATL